MIRIEVRGTKLAALITIVFPVAMHSGAIHPIGIIAGKFQGAIPANTPTGSRYWVVSYPGVAFMIAGPFNNCGAPAANSTTSVTFSTSPMASSQFLPCSSATRRVSSSWCRSRRAFIRKRTCTLLFGGVSAHAGKAALAAAIADSTSEGVHCGVRATTSPIEGS